jgi:hypothetical protein
MKGEDVTPFNARKPELIITHYTRFTKEKAAGTK